MNVLFVCTANICRSAYAEYALRSMITSNASSAEVQIASAGVHALAGHPADPVVVDACRSRGYTGIEEHRSQPLDRALVGWADVVFAATREHRDVAIRHLPKKVNACYTMLEGARIFEALDLGAWAEWTPQALVASMAKRRSSVAALDDELDIADPYGRDTATYERAFGDIEYVVSVLCRTLPAASA